LIYKILNPKSWIKFFLLLNKKERGIFILLVLFLIFSNFFLFDYLYQRYTIKVPARGGVLKEGVVGQPHLINPIYSSANDADQDLVELTFNGLLKFNLNNEIIPDLAESYKVENNGRVYEVTLKKNILWQDKQPITIEDVIYTIKVIQDPSYKSPLRLKWTGVEIQKENERTIKFILEKPFPSFLETLATTKIIPKHVWQNIPSENFPLVEYNLQKVVGSGPYQIEEVVFGPNHNISVIKLKENSLFFGEKPYIPKIEFYFFPNEKELFKKVKSHFLTSFNLTNPRYLDELLKDGYYQKQRLQMPRYFALFLNQEQNQLLENKNIRRALALAINRKKIIKEVFLNQGEIVNSPILPNFYGFDYSLKSQSNPSLALELLEKEGFHRDNNNFLVKIRKNEEKIFTKDLKKGSQGEEVKILQECLAKDKEIYPEGEVTGYFGEKTKKAVIRFQEKYKEEILKPSGLTKGTGLVGPSTRKKLNKICGNSSEEIIPLEFTISTLDQDVLLKTAQAIKNDWEALGIKTNIITYDFPSLKEEVIKERNYQILLFGEMLGKFPDPFPFWHSSQKKDPGLNLSLFENRKADRLLEKIRETNQEKERKKDLIQFARIIDEEEPAIFLFNPYYLYFLSPNLQNFQKKKIFLPAERFSNVTDWYLKTKRVWNITKK